MRGETPEAREKRLVLYATRRAKYVRLFGSRCARCGDTTQLEFDHIDCQTKTFSMIGLWRCKESKIEEELKKCQLLCKPCHSTKTYEERGFQGRHHGTNSMYSVHGCRCDECRAAHTESRKIRRRRLAAERKKANG